MAPMLGLGWALFTSVFCFGILESQGVATQKGSEMLSQDKHHTTNTGGISYHAYLTPPSLPNLIWTTTERVLVTLTVNQSDLSITNDVTMPKPIRTLDAKSLDTDTAEVVATHTFVTQSDVIGLDVNNNTNPTNAMRDQYFELFIYGKRVGYANISITIFEQYQIVHSPSVLPYEELQNTKNGESFLHGAILNDAVNNSYNSHDTNNNYHPPSDVNIAMTTSSSANTLIVGDINTVSPQHTVLTQKPDVVSDNGADYKPKVEAGESAESSAANATVVQRIVWRGYLSVTVLSEKTLLQDVFLAVLAIFMVLLNLGFGCCLDLHVVWTILRKPVAPAVGLFSQVIILPLVALTVSHLLHMDPLLGLGLFVYACSPGGTSSNLWTVLVNGDLDLSVTMTLCTKTLALVSMPAWLWLAAPIYQTRVQIPHVNLALGLAAIALPCLAGILLQVSRPLFAYKIARYIKPLSLVSVCWTVIVGSLANYYVYPVMLNEWYIIPAAVLFPYLGISIGALLAYLFKQPKSRISTIAIETGMQDTGLACLLLMASLGQPADALAAAAPLAAAIVTPFPFAIISLVIHCRNRKAAKKAKSYADIYKPEVNDVLMFPEANVDDVIASDATHPVQLLSVEVTKLGPPCCPVSNDLLILKIREK